MSGSGHVLTPEKIKLILCAMEELETSFVRLIWSNVASHHGHLVRRVKRSIN